MTKRTRRTFSPEFKLEAAHSASNSSAGARTLATIVTNAKSL